LLAVAGVGRRASERHRRRVAARAGGQERTKLLEESARSLHRSFRSRVSSARLAHDFPEVAKKEREATALAALGRTLCRVDLQEEAEAGFRRALELRPNFLAGEEGLLLVLRGRDRHEKALSLAEKITGRRPKDPVGHPAAANAFHLLGRKDAALQRIEGLLGGYPDLEVAHLNRIATLMGGGDGGRGEAGIRAYLTRRPSVRLLPRADHLLVAPRQNLDDYTA
jgi:tetratricopeptide (TPR) repeat protein